MSYSAQDVIDLSELADLIEAKLDTVLDSKTTHEHYRGELVKHLSDTYAR